MLPQEAKDKHHLTQAQKEKAVFTDIPAHHHLFQTCSKF